jgi:hypothetical protein
VPRWIWASATALGLAVVGGYAVWRHVGPHVLSSAEYQIDPQKIEVTAPPPWIRTNVKAEAVHDASLAGPLSLLDSHLTVRMASAFAAHPWVARVERVSKRYPSSVEVVLSYRKPVAMVDVQGGALPVDVDAVILPSGDFEPKSAERYPRIDEIHTAPSGQVGKCWSDPAVVGGVRVAAVLGADWQQLGLARIVPGVRKPARSGFEYEYMLYTRGGTRIDWGRAPSPDGADGSPPSAKLARLRDYVARHGSLDGKDGPQRLRFSETGQLQVERLSPVKPLPQSKR